MKTNIVLGKITVAPSVSLHRLKRKSEAMETDREGQTTEQENKIFKKEKMTDFRKCPHAVRKQTSQAVLPFQTQRDEWPGVPYRHPLL